MPGPVSFVFATSVAIMTIITIRGIAMNQQKALEFHGNAAGYFIVTLVNLVMTYIPFFGWAFAFNFSAKWIADNAMVNGKKVSYTATYGESLKFVSINALILIITFGIYIFWFAPKMYRYVADHTQYLDEAGVAAAPVAPDVAQAPEAPQAPAEPAAPADTTAEPAEPAKPEAPTTPAVS
jgi:hypothetical protein